MSGWSEGAVAQDDVMLSPDLPLRDRIVDPRDPRAGPGGQSAAGVVAIQTGRASTPSRGTSMRLAALGLSDPALLPLEFSQGAPPLFLTFKTLAALCLFSQILLLTLGIQPLLLF